MFAIVNLKHSKKSFVIVRTTCIQNFQGKFSNTNEFLCYISPNKDETPNFDEAEYKREYCGSPGLFKVFVTKLFGKRN